MSLGVEGVQDLAGGGVDVADGAAQPDRPHASPGGEGAVEPLVVVVAGGAVEQFVVEGPGARPGPRAGVGQDGDQGQRRVAHAAGLLVIPAAALPSWVRTRQVIWQSAQW